MNTHATGCIQNIGKFRILSLSVLWFFGLLFGVYLATFLKGQSFSFLSLDNTSLLATFFVNAFPVVLLVLILNSSFFFLCYPFILLEGMCYSFCAMLLFFHFGSCAWLFRILVFFFRSCTCTILWGLMIRHCIPNRYDLSKSILAVSALFVLATFFQFFAINPFINVLVNYL